jgi:hypothetical protein
MELVADLPDARKMPAIRAVLEALRAEFKPGVAALPLWLDRFLDASGNSQPGGMAVMSEGGRHGEYVADKAERHTTIASFLTRPERRTRVRVRRALGSLYVADPTHTAKAVESAVNVLLAELSGDRLEGAQRDVLGFLGELHRRFAGKPPPWEPQRASAPARE